MTEQSQRPENAPAGPQASTAPPAVPGPRPAPPGAPTGDGPTGDAQIDTAIADLEGAAPDDLDAQIEAGQRVHRTLQSRLSDLGGQ
jgi:DNA polymerase-3 subunit gamma/tau